MRGAWLMCALSLARASETPLPGDPVLNEQWLEGFRRDLLRDTYDYDTDPKPSPSILGEQSSGRSAYLTHAPKNTSHAMPSDSTPSKPGPATDSPVGRSTSKPARRDLNAARRRSSRTVSARDVIRRVSGKPSLDALDDPSVGPAHPLVHESVGQSSEERGLPSDTPDAPWIRYSSGKPLARRSKDEKSIELSGEQGLPSDMPDAPSVRHSSGKPDRYTSHTPDPAPDASDAPTLARSSGKLQARQASDASTGKQGRPVDPPDAPFVGRPSGRPPAQAMDDAASRELGISRRDLYGGRRRSVTGLDAKRETFLKSLADLDNQMRPVVIRPDLNMADKSRKRLGHESGEQNQEKPDYIVDDRNGVRLYRVHTNRKERFRNQFGRDEPWLKEDWGIDEMPEPNAHQEKEDDPARSEDRYQESREPREDSTLHKQDSASQEVDVSEYNQDNLRSRYIQDGRSNGDYAQRFSARRDAALLADGLASSKKPCNCMTDNPQIVPEL